MDRKLRVTFSHATLVAIFLFLMKNCLYLVDTSLISVVGVISYADIWLVLYVLYMFYIAFKYRNIRVGIPYFALEIIAVIVICILSAFQAHRLFGQSIVLGIRPQRFFIVIMLSYFPMRKLLVAEKMDLEKLKKAIISFALIEAVLSIIQQFVYNYFVFMYCLTNVRYGSVRLYLSSSVITLAMFFAMEGIINKKNFNKNVIMLIIGIIYMLTVIKGRLTTISTISALLGGFILMKGISVRKIFYAAVVIVLILGFSRTQMFRDLTDTIEIENGEIGGDTLDIRNEGRKHYFDRLDKNPYLGGGYPNELYAPAANAAGYYDEIMLNDNGIFGLMYVYGYVGIAIFAILFLRLLYLVWRIYKDNSVYSMIMYIIMVSVQAVNIAAWYWQNDGIFVLLLVMCMSEAIYLKRENAESEKNKKRIRIVWRR